VRGAVAAAVGRREVGVAGADAAQQAGAVGQALGDDVQHQALALHPAAARDHAGRQHQPALLREQSGPQDV